MIHGLVKDEAGILWMGTNKGMIKYDPASRGSYTYYYSKGIEIWNFVMIVIIEALTMEIFSLGE